jgi:hypothetical protein
MKFIFTTHDPDFSEGLKTKIMNGGTAPQYHLSHTLESMGHESRLVPLSPDESWKDADFIFVQSEWYSVIARQLQELRRGKTKLIVWIGHWKSGNYFNPVDIQADYYVTTWKGDVLKSVPFGEQILYFPHAYCPVCDRDQNVPSHQLIWFGNKYPLRDESWLDGLPITRLNAIMPNLLGSYYRRATICPNIHGGFQKGEVSSDPSSIADLPGYALNERLFATVGAGGFQICDWSPLIDETYADDEVVKCRSVAQFQEACHRFLRNPQLRQPYIEKALARTLTEYTYQHRINDLLKHIGVCAS